MYVKDALRPGQFVTLVPVGLPVTLQYNKKGILEKIYRDYGEDRVDITSTLFDTVFHNKMVPTSITVKDGDTMVEGVFYQNKFYCGDGKCEEIASEGIIHDIQVDHTDIHFAAGNVYSYAASFKDANTIRRWLKMSLFDLLPGFIVPVLMNKEGMYNLIASQVKLSSPELKAYLDNKTPLISRYMVFGGTGVQHVNINLTQVVITKILRYTDQYGAYHIKLNAKGWNKSIPYSTASHFHIRQKVNVVLDSAQDIVYTSAPDGDVLKPYDAIIHCDWCGKVFSAGAYKDETICPDVHCLSRQFLDMEHMFTVLGLPSLQYSEYEKLCQEKSIMWIPDLFLLPQYKQVKLEVTLDKLLDAIIPVFAVPDRQSIQSLVNHCSNTKSTLQHYIHNPDRIVTDFGLPAFKMNKLVGWLSDSQNAKTVETLMFSDNFEIISTGLKFEGAPIFRNKIIMVTGDFAHGSKEDVANILRSYSATVTFHYDDTVQCVLVGDSKTDIDGQAIRQARWDHVPVMDEADFFAQYEIDDDLIKNGLM